MTRTYTTEQKQEIRRLYEEGKSLREVAGIFGIKHPWSVRRLVKIAGGTLREGGGAQRRSIHEEHLVGIIRRYKDGEYAHTIAKDFNVTGRTVLHYLRRSGVVIRKGGATPAVLPQQKQNEAVRLYLEGMWIVAIAKQLDTNHRKVRDALITADVPIRRPGRQARLTP